MTYHEEQIDKPARSLLMTHMGKTAALILLIVAGILIFTYRNSLSGKISKAFAAADEDPVPVTKLGKQEFSLTVPATGEVVGLETTPVPTPNTPSGSLKLSWLIPEGSFVKQGDLLVRFDNTDAKLSLEKQQNTLDANQENTKITASTQTTDEKVLGYDRKDAELEYDYAMTVMPQDESIFSKWDIITAQADARYAKERIEFLKNKGKTQKRIARADQQILAIERNRALSEIDVIKQTLNSLELRAPVGGLALYRREFREDPKIGDECHPGQVLVEVVNLNVLQARIYILERDGGHLAKDQTVVMRLDALPEKQYEGKIRSVSAVAAALERNSPLRYFTCDVAIENIAGDLKRVRPGMYLKGDVVLEKYESCFVIPSSAITYREKEKDTVVLLKKGKKFVEQSVKTGLSSHGEAVILSGVNSGDVVALRNPKETRKLYLPDFSKGDSASSGGMPFPPPGGRGMMIMMRRGR
jgi:HlyD family secretion protein